MKTHLPRNNNQTSRIRSLLLNINDGAYVTSHDYNIDENEFNAYFKALEKSGYICLIEGKEEYIITSYVIADIDKFNKFKNNAYKIIEKYIIPLLGVACGIAQLVVGK